MQKAQVNPKAVAQCWHVRGALRSENARSFTVPWRDWFHSRKNWKELAAIIQQLRIGALEWRATGILRALRARCYKLNREQMAPPKGSNTAQSKPFSPAWSWILH